MTTIFGTPWDAPFCEDATRADTPVGEPCLWCTVPIHAGDDGVITPYVAAQGAARPAPWHKECFALQVVGPVVHLRAARDPGHTPPPDQLCTCQGGPRLVGPRTAQAKRAEALEAWQLLTGGTRPD